MLKIFLKLTLAAGILIYLIYKGELDFSLIGSMAQNHPDILFLGWILIGVSSLGSAIRYRMLLNIQSEKKISLLSSIRLTWIGLFFSSVLPGAVTGDIIKLIYAKELDPKFTKTFLLTSTLMDRVIGLTGLLFLLGIFTILNYTQITSLSPELSKLVFFNLLLFFGILFFFITLFLPSSIQNFLIKLPKKIPFFGSQIKKTLEEFWEIGKNKKVVVSALALSILMQANNVFILWFLGLPNYENSLSLYMGFTFIPLGLIAIAVPISPAGLGVGHAIFSTLFGYYGIKGGASFFNIYFLTLVSLNLTGVIPYILSGKKRKGNSQSTLSEIFNDPLEDPSKQT